MSNSILGPFPQNVSQAVGRTDSKRPSVKRVALIACFFTASGGKCNDASTGMLCLFRLRRKRDFFKTCWKVNRPSRGYAFTNSNQSRTAKNQNKKKATSRVFDL
jgi:hypothetical protein